MFIARFSMLTWAIEIRSTLRTPFRSPMRSTMSSVSVCWLNTRMSAPRSAPFRGPTPSSGSAVGEVSLAVVAEPDGVLGGGSAVLLSSSPQEVRQTESSSATSARAALLPPPITGPG